MLTYKPTHIFDKRLGLNPENEVSGDFRGDCRGVSGGVLGPFLDLTFDKFSMKDYDWKWVGNALGGIGTQKNFAYGAVVGKESTF